MGKFGGKGRGSGVRSRGWDRNAYLGKRIESRLGVEGWLLRYSSSSIKPSIYAGLTWIGW
jgi:hypothetical protein